MRGWWRRPFQIDIHAKPLSEDSKGLLRGQLLNCSQPADPESALAFRKDGGGFGLVGDIQLLLLSLVGSHCGKRFVLFDVRFVHHRR